MRIPFDCWQERRGATEVGAHSDAHFQLVGLDASAN